MSASITKPNSLRKETFFQSKLRFELGRINFEKNFYKAIYSPTNRMKILMHKRFVFESFAPYRTQNSQFENNISKPIFCMDCSANVDLGYENLPTYKKNCRNRFEKKTPGNCKKIGKNIFSRSTYNSLPIALSFVGNVLLYRSELFFEKFFEKNSENVDILVHFMYYLFYKCLEEEKRHQKILDGYMFKHFIGLWLYLLKNQYTPKYNLRPIDFLNFQCILFYEARK